MEAGSKATAAKVASNIAKRFATLALPMGFSIGEFVAASKDAFINAATDILKSRKIRPTTSRIAVMTGLTRAEVARIRDGVPSLPAAVSEPRTERVMNAWFTEPDYLDESGNPRHLPEFGSNSFDTLVRHHSGDMPRRALLEELIAGGMAARSGDRLIRPIRRHHSSASKDHSDLTLLSSEVEFLVPTAEKKTTQWINVEFAGPIPAAVRRNIEQRTERFLEGLSDYLHAESKKLAVSASEKTTVFRLLIANRESTSESENQ